MAHGVISDPELEIRPTQLRYVTVKYSSGKQPKTTVSFHHDDGATHRLRKGILPADFQLLTPKCSTICSLYEKILLY